MEGASFAQQAAGRFQLEARLGAMIDNPNVVRIYDFEAATDHTFYLRMEYCAGATLQIKLEHEKRLSVAATVKLAQDLCAGLAAIHATDSVHRDLKPSNIFFDENGMAKIGDLGLVQTPLRMSTDRSKGSLAPKHPGTPEYMSPEQEFKTATLRPNSDLYSLGCVLFECLTGKVYKLNKGASASDHNDNVPDWLDALIERLLEETVARKKRDDADETKRFRNVGLVQAVLPEVEITLPETKAERAAEMEDLRAVAARERALREQAEREKAALEKANAANQRQAAADVEAERQRLVTLEAEKAAAEKQAKEQARQLEKYKQRAAANKKADADRQAQDAERQRKIAREEAAQAEKRQRRVAAQKITAYRPKPIVKANPAGIDWIEIPAGDFLYGDNKETRTIENAYKIGKTPVTNAQYKTFIDAHPQQPVPTHWDSKTRTFRRGHAQKPVVYISWEDAQLFCKWAKCRLPSELEWEKAARGTDGREYPWGAAAPTDKHCNFSRGFDFKAGHILTNVGDFSPKGDSPYGCQDMAGNVWEWCKDWYDDEKKYRLLRGGSWINDGALVRCAYRDYCTPTSRVNDVGFRVALLLNF